MSEVERSAYELGYEDALKELLERVMQQEPHLIRDILPIVQGLSEDSLGQDLDWSLEEAEYE